MTKTATPIADAEARLATAIRRCDSLAEAEARRDLDYLHAANALRVGIAGNRRLTAEQAAELARLCSLYTAA